MNATTRRIREMSVIVESDIARGLTLDEYRRTRSDPTPRRTGRVGRLLARPARFAASR